MTTPEVIPTGPLDGVEAMLSILSALAGRRPVTCQDLETLTGLSSPRRGYAAILQEDGLVIFERQQALRLTNSGEALMRDLGKPSAGRCTSSNTGTGDGYL